MRAAEEASIDGEPSSGSDHKGGDDPVTDDSNDGDVAEEPGHGEAVAVDAIDTGSEEEWCEPFGADKTNKTKQNSGLPEMQASLQTNKQTTSLQLANIKQNPVEHT